MIKWIWCGVFLLCISAVSAQEASNAYRVSWKEAGTAMPAISGLDLLTGFNKKGYNNQPAVQSNTLYLASSWKERSNDATNIIALDLKDQEVRMITRTPYQEFSPTPSGQNLYFVRMDPETGFQQLWKSNKNVLTKVLPESNVAYFMPINESRMATVLIEDQSLVLYVINLDTNEKKLITRNAGRSMAVNKNNILYFVHKYTPQSWYIKSFDPLTGQVSIICNTIGGSEDLFLSDNDFFWMAKDSRIYRIALEEALGNNWKNILDLKEFGLNNIKRLCVIDDNNLILINQ